jgi:uncharacterized protein (TIGR02145 family)
VPSGSEWFTLNTYLGGLSVAGGKLKMVGTTYWNSPNTDATNVSGFSALPGGFRNNDGSFYFIKRFAIFWGSGVLEDGSPYAPSIESDNSKVEFLFNIASYGTSIRCLKN